MVIAEKESKKKTYYCARCKKKLRKRKVMECIYFEAAIMGDWDFDSHDDRRIARWRDRYINADKDDRWASFYLSPKYMNEYFKNNVYLLCPWCMKLLAGFMSGKTYRENETLDDLRQENYSLHQKLESVKKLLNGRFDLDDYKESQQ